MAKSKADKDFIESPWAARDEEPKPSPEGRGDMATLQVGQDPAPGPPFQTVCSVNTIAKNSTSSHRIKQRMEKNHPAFGMAE